ncbi:MAG TPA: tRNA (adenosine(37)-N6)-dimethylallyltransferase MiaA [Candidatus Binatus sp.]|jgi:tRNA dimethylallyltransferase|nr:tRNA (adenosine(37)-N6)-dimethylallyltransferase MiaA [Candidatus Binatus sp.]
MSALAPVIVILGPTASGKSSLAIWLAEKLSGEVLVCDSTQAYKYFDIGTAKVALSEQHGIAHHLVDLCEPEQIFTAGEYRRRALQVLEEVTQRKKLPILTAGTGLYLRALLEGLSDAPERSEELRTRLRERAECRGPEHLHRILARLDPASASRIASRDTQKVIRAIEMRILAKKPVAEIHGEGRRSLEGYGVKKIGLSPAREDLYARIEERTESMIRDGWLDEVSRLVAKGISPESKPFQFIGYSELRSHLNGQLTMESAAQKIQQATRQFAKRQLTWFRKEPAVHWLPGFGDDPLIAAAALEFLKGSRP